jgi:ubiquinone/menaquinone biosynthesis methyltransferase
MPTSSSHDIYDTQYVSGLFDRMSKTYGVVNYLSSFGFTERWRRQCINEIEWHGAVREGYDFMSGMGECWHLIKGKGFLSLTGIDISPVMVEKSKEQLKRYPHWQVEARVGNALNSDLPDESADFIVATFGLKTFSPDQLIILADEMYRLLRPGGQFSMIEVSRPKPILLRWLFMFYLKLVIPVIGKYLAGDAESYRMLGEYTDRFGDCQDFYRTLQSRGFEVEMKSYFFSCATGVSGRKWSS